jgi:hypothetical protein
VEIASETVFSTANSLERVRESRRGYDLFRPHLHTPDTIAGVLLFIILLTVV